MSNSTEEMCQKTCKYEFNDEEKKALASRMAEASAKAEDLETEKKEVSASIKSRIETNAKELRDFGKKYRDGYEWRKMECRRVYLYSDSTVITYRTDTGEQVESRAMTTAERQQAIKGV